jgi:CRP-like cAMP-binding protein
MTTPTRFLLLRPEPTEYPPRLGKYISLVPEGNILQTLETQLRSTEALLAGLGEDQGNQRYAPEKWTIRQVLGHLADTERILAYRALRIARHDKTPLAGFEQDDYVRCGPFEHCLVAELVEEFGAVRNSTLHLFRHLDEESWSRRGIVNQGEVSVRAIGYVIAGHELHHVALLKDKYLLSRHRAT